MEPEEFEVHDRVLRKYEEPFEPGAGTIVEIITCYLHPCARVLWDKGSTSCADLRMLKHEQPKDTSEDHPITFYNIQDDIPIGGFAKVGNYLFKIVKEDWCVNCELELTSLCGATQCTSDKRADRNSISFILYDTIPEDNDEQPWLDRR